MSSCYIIVLSVRTEKTKGPVRTVRTNAHHQWRQNQKSGRQDQGVVINSECQVQERNRKIAEALEIDQPTISSELDVIYPESVR